MLENNVVDLKGVLLPDPTLVITAIDRFYEIKTIDGSMTQWKAIGNLWNDEIKKLQRTLFKIVMAQARKNEIGFVSIGPQDFITPNYSKPSGPFEGKLFTWDMAKYIGISSCGNGKGDHCGQYQIPCMRYFGEQHFAIWDPKSETKIHENPFSLRTSGLLITDFLKAMNKNKLEHFIEHDVVFKQLHVDLKETSR